MPDINLSLKVPAIEKLIDYGASGVGAIAGPMLAPWRASREAKARLASARIDVEVHRIEAESEAGTSAIIAKARSEARGYLVAPDAEIRGTLEITREDITQRIEFQERKRLANVRSVLEDAADELGDKEVTDHEPDPDWTARYIDSVQDVSSEDLQKVWAKILAGEVESPGRTSLRTLDTLRNMTKRDAEMFRDICDFVLMLGDIFHNGSVDRFTPLKYDYLAHLQECGLIRPARDTVRRVQITDTGMAFTSHAINLLIKGKTNDNDELQIPVLMLTVAGRELYRFVQCKPPEDYLQAFSAFLKSNDCELFCLEEITPLPNGKVQYEKSTRIIPEPEPVEGATP